MFRTIIVCIAFVCIAGLQNAEAKILRVGYLGTPVTGIDFPTFNSAVINAAVAGDTIQVYQNNASVSGTIAIAKKLFIVGFGYMLDKNPGLQAVSLADNTIGIYFNAGSEGSIVQGLNLTTVYVGTNEITFTRCRFQGYVYLGYNSAGQNVDVSDINIFSNFFSGYSIFDQGIVSTLLISNNVFYGNSITLDNSSGIFTNNIISSSPATLNSFVVRNNISNSCISSSGSVFQNNLFSIPATSCTNVSVNNNLFSVSMLNVFTNWNNGTLTADNQITLKAGSPAINAGINGVGAATDAGVFGGDPGFTYRLSGIPPIPSISQLSAPSQTASNNPYTITVSVKSNN